MYLIVTNVEDCKLLRCYINSVQNWHLDNDMKLDICETTVISFTRKSSSIRFSYKLCNKLVAGSLWAKDLGMLLYCKLSYHILYFLHSFATA
jgi:hypothetical protein